MQQLCSDAQKFDDFPQDRLVEYLDVNAEDDVNIALHERDIMPATTHLELRFLKILRAVAGLNLYPHQNQSSRIDQDVLTRRGWKNIASVRGDDEVMSLNKETLAQEWQAPTRAFRRKNDGRTSSGYTARSFPPAAVTAATTSGTAVSTATATDTAAAANVPPVSRSGAAIVCPPAAAGADVQLVPQPAEPSVPEPVLDTPSVPLQHPRAAKAADAANI
ncbi:RNA polymerase Rpb2, domain 5 [Kalmanozyma brasiliensis GHG001]|uniref:RNA polymerase Rpb2, domain 5 n=1 Tax=Kalmanozyma brasiliensis (strain GHG001) TaxID=1365824 RepID=UPI002867CFD2|nr:RNA polymerase Rpb2, domain 5 [Kalmanozyma brasiliensis GHG001]KAF6767468.1 RNA polymerase Rpb2, domain 5 [Kalmanozyma brasiliensis GHG001]